MTDIDPQADLEIRFAGEHVTVKVPLAGPVTGEWLQDYQKLALAAKVRAQAGTCDDRAWIIVTMPASSDHRAMTRGDVGTLIPPGDIHNHGHVRGTDPSPYSLILLGDDMYLFERNEYDPRQGTWRQLAPGDPGRSHR